MVEGLVIGGDSVVTTGSAKSSSPLSVQSSHLSRHARKGICVLLAGRKGRVQRDLGSFFFCGLDLEETSYKAMLKRELGFWLIFVSV